MKSLSKSVAAYMVTALFLQLGSASAEPCATSPSAPSASSTAAGKLSAQKQASITVTVDPRVELVAIAQHLSGYTNNPRFKGRINEFDHPYANAMKQHFAGFQGHESLQRLAALRIGGSEPTNIAVHMTSPDDVALPLPLERTFIRDKTAPDYVACLRDFAKASRFMDFFETTKADRDAIVADFEKTIDLPAVAARVEAYCGTQPARYTIELAPLLGRTSFGPSATAPDGSTVFYAIFPAAKVVDGHLVFGESSMMPDYLYHEFGHSFVNPLVDKYWNELVKFSALMDKIPKSQPGNYGPEWKVNVYEHIVRAVAARIILQQKGDAAYAAQLSRDQRAGFVFIGDLCRSLETYEQGRSTFANLDSYFPELIRVFAALHQAAPEATPQS